MTEEQTADGRRIVYAPLSTYPYISTGVLSVALADDEDVEWHWSHSEAGSVVTGYTVSTKPDLCSEKFKHEMLEAMVSHLRDFRFPFP